MATFSKVVLSGGTSGADILVAATATAGTLIHTAHATALDEVWLWAVNNTTSDVVLTIEFGGTTSTKDLIIQTVTTKSGLMTIVPGICLTGSLVVRAFAGTTNVISVAGFVNRIT
jgi:hypothetical protein